jgi:hypothetical protein
MSQAGPKNSETGDNSFKTLPLNAFLHEFKLTSGEEAEKAAHELVVSITSAYRCSHSISDLNKDLLGSDQLLLLRKLWYEINDPACKTEVRTQPPIQWVPGLFPWG